MAQEIQDWIESELMEFMEMHGDINGFGGCMLRQCILIRLDEICDKKDAVKAKVMSAKLCEAYASDGLSTG